MATLASYLRKFTSKRLEHDADFHVVYEFWSPKIFRFLSDMLATRELAEEATQETFARALIQCRDEVSVESKPAWLFGIARNVALENIRRQKRNALDCACPSDAVNTLTPERSCENAQSIQHVNAALLLLDEPRRTALLLRLEHALPYEDIARVMSWSLSKTKVEVHRAKQKLQIALAEWRPL